MPSWSDSLLWLPNQNDNTMTTKFHVSSFLHRVDLKIAQSVAALALNPVVVIGVGSTPTFGEECVFQSPFCEDSPRFPNIPVCTIGYIPTEVAAKVSGFGKCECMGKTLGSTILSLHPIPFREYPKNNNTYTKFQTLNQMLAVSWKVERMLT